MENNRQVLSHYAEHLNLKLHCKSTILQLKKKKGPQMAQP